MRIAILVSAGKNPVSGQPRHCRNDSLALQLGLNLAEDVKVLHAGDANSPALQDYLALGAKQIDVISADNMIENFAEQLSHTDLVLTGMRAENGEDSGLLPYLLAAKLNLPIVTGALDISARASEIEVLQFLPKGQRRRVKVRLPAIVVAHPLAPVELRYIEAQRGLGSINTLTANNTSVSIAASQWQVEPLRKPIKLVASAALTGHERLMAAISSKAKGGAVVNEGNNVEKAQVVLAYLREHQLIDF